MARSIDKTLHVRVNGKEVENNLKSIKSAITKVTHELNKMTHGTDEYYEKSKDLLTLKQIYREYNKELSVTNKKIEEANDSVNASIFKWGAYGSAISGASVVLQKFVSSTQEYVEAYATIDDAMTGVMKTTGMTREEVEALNESLKSIDTRTSQEELLTIAQIGGRMGLAKDQILDFTKAVDLANVALGDSFSGGAEEISSVLGKISLAFKETRDANIGDSLTRIGSAINEVGGKANATEPNIAAFVQRVGSMPEAFRPSVQEAVALGAAFEESSIDAEVASRAFGILMNKASTDVEGFARVMGQPVEAVRELINTNPTQFFTEFAKSLQGMDATQIGETLKGLKLNADGVVKIVGAMSGSYDRFNEILQVSNSAFSENTSLMNEFNNVNNNSAAQLEKARKRMQEARVELGEKLIPMITRLYEILGSTSGWLTKHSAITKTLIAAFASYVAVIGLATVKAKAMMAVEKVHSALVAAKTAIIATHRTVVLGASVAYNTMTGATTRAAAAQKLLKAAFASTPWGAIITAVVTVVAAIVSFIKNTNEATSAMDDFNAAVAKEQSEVDYLFNKLKNAEKGTDEYKEALQQLIDKYPEVMAKHIDEKGRLDDINRAYQDVIQSIQTKIAMETKDKAIQDASASALEKQRNSLDLIRENLKKQGKTDAVANNIVEDLKKLMDKPDSKENKIEIWKFLLENNIDTIFKSGLFKKNFNGLINDYMNAAKELKEETESITESFDPFIEKPLSEVEELQKKMKDLQNQMQKAEDKEPYKKQIDALKEQIRLKKEAQKTTSNPSTSSSPSSSSSPSPSSSTKDPVADFEKKLADFRQRQQAASLDGWEKTKQGIIDSYQEMIDEANHLNQTQTAKDLETERDDAIKAAGEKYVKNASDAFDKVMKEADEMLKSTSNSGEENKLLDAVAGTQKQWDEKIRLVRENYNAIKQILDDDDDLKADDPNKLTAEQRTVFENGLQEAARAELELTTEKMQAITNVVKANVSDEKQFITEKETELRRSRMNDYDRQIEEIETLYNARIEAKRKEIESLKALRNTDGIDNEELQKKIEELEALIDKLEGLKSSEKGNVKKTPSSDNVWDKLLNIDWSKFKDNWRDNLQTMTAALQEFANTAFDIFNSINQIQSNRENAAFDEWCDIQDEKADTLQRQLDDGIISQKYYDAQMNKMQKEKEAKEKKIQHDQFERDKKANIIQATINGALAIVTAFAQLGPIAGAIAAVLTAATTAAQIAVIASQANPYAKGGFIRKEQIALMGEEGEEWVASHKLLTDKKTAPVINALESYQRGDQQALDALSPVSEPSWENLSQSSKMISRTFATQSQNVTNVYNTNNSNNTTTTNHNGDNSELLKEIRQMNAYLKDPKNRQAYITRKMQLEFDKQEQEIKEMSRL